jgi:hypothetical protein
MPEESTQPRRASMRVSCSQGYPEYEEANFATD